MLTITEVAQLLHVHNNTLRRWSDKGLIRSYHINRRGDRRFMQNDILRFLEQYRANSGNPKQVDMTWD